MAEQPEFRPPNFTLQEASQYKADIDSSVALLGRIGAAFAPHQKPEIAEVSEVTTVDDTGVDPLDGTYFTISSPDTDFYVWLNATDVSGLLDPGLSGATGIQVDFTTDDTAPTIAAAINSAVDAQAELNSSVSGDIVTISSRDEGAVAVDIADGASGNATGFNLVVTIQGGDGPDDLDVYIDAGFVLNDPDLGGNNGMEDIAQQIVTTITAPSSDPRIDRIVIDIETGIVEVVTGAEDATPTIPDIPSGKAPCCQFRLETGTTIITNGMIVDERVSPLPLIEQVEGSSLEDTSSTLVLIAGTKYVAKVLTGNRTKTFDSSDILQGQRVNFLNIDSAQNLILRTDDTLSSYTLEPHEWIELEALSDSPTTETDWIKVGGSDKLQILSSGTSWNPPAFIFRVWAEVYGGGAGGAAGVDVATSTASTRVAGGAGGVSMGYVAVTPGTNVTYAIGSGGTGGSSEGGAGTDGGNSTFAGLAGNGGEGGTFVAGEGIGGNASGGDINLRGGGGSSSVGQTKTIGNAGGAAGGSNGRGNGGNGGLFTTDGTDGTIFGGGGGGGGADSTGGSSFGGGGNGGAGRVLLLY